MHEPREINPLTPAEQKEDIRAQIAFFIWISVLPLAAAGLNLGRSGKGMGGAESMASIIVILAAGALGAFALLLAAAFIIGSLTRTRAVSVGGYLLGLPIALIVFNITR